MKNEFYNLFIQDQIKLKKDNKLHKNVRRKNNRLFDLYHLHLVKVEQFEGSSTFVIR
jgi:hypothetical protein